MSTPEKASPGQNSFYPAAITLLDCRELDTAGAHRQLGQDARSQVHKILTKRLDGLGSRENVAAQILRARGYQAALNSKMGLPGLEQDVREALKQYQACLSAWAQGAGLESFRHPHLPQTCAGEPIRAEDLATLLQEDEVGCQTGVLRESQGGVILWHSEEDYELAPGDRFDRFRLFLFRGADGRDTCGFIYPDLLPGPTFGWQADNYAQHDYAQAVDSLHARQKPLENAILPNTLAWISLYLGGLAGPQSLAEKLGPFQGGYSLMALSRREGIVSVEKVEFMNDQLTAGSLETEAGKTFFQTNIIRDLSQPIGAEEQTRPENRVWNEVRLARTERFLQVIRKSSQPLPLVLRMLRSRLGGESAYANHYVKATFVCRMEPQKTSFWLNGTEIFIPLMSE